MRRELISVLRAKTFFFKPSGISGLEFSVGRIVGLLSLAGRIYNSRFPRSWPFFAAESGAYLISGTQAAWSLSSIRLIISLNL
jgi:hypothetical protein